MADNYARAFNEIEVVRAPFCFRVELFRERTRARSHLRGMIFMANYVDVKRVRAFVSLDRYRSFEKTRVVDGRRAVKSR